jgi:hypothetical protein
MSVATAEKTVSFRVNGREFTYTSQQTREAAAAVYNRNIIGTESELSHLVTKVNEYVDRYDLRIFFSVILLDALLKCIDDGSLSISAEDALPEITLL